MERLQQKYSNDGLAVLGVGEERFDEVRQFLEAMGITYPTLYDPNGVVFLRYHIHAPYATFIISRDSVLRMRLEGFGGVRRILKAVKLYLAQTR